MAETIGAAIVDVALAAGAAEGSAALVVGEFLFANAAIVNAVAVLAIGNAQAQAAKRRARDAAAAAAQDRHITIRSAMAPRREVLGRAPTGGDLLWVASTGASKDTLAMVVAISAREIDAVEQVFVGGEPVTLDGSGYVTSEPFTSTNKTTAKHAITYTGAGTYTLPQPPIAGTVVAGYEGTYSTGVGNGDAVDIPVVGVAGNTVTLGAAAYSGSATVTYQHYSTNQALRIIIHTGAPGAVVDPTLNALFPSEWDASHELEGIAYAVIIAKYSPDAFFSGLKDISFLVRGSKVYDPRTGTTAWSENPALLKRHVCMQPLDPAIAPIPVNDAWCIAAANVCDQTVSYTVDGVPKTRKRYVAGTVYSDGEEPRVCINQLKMAMAGGWVFTGGELRMRAGAYTAPVMTLTDAHIGSGEVSITTDTALEQLVNVANGKAFDPDNRWQYLDVPEVRSSTFIAADGAAMPPMQVDLEAVNDMAQAQQILAILLRESRGAPIIRANFRMSAYAVEVFDTVNLQLTRYFGSTPLPCLVLARTWSFDPTSGAPFISLTLRVTGASVYADGTAFDATVLPPANLRPVPWQVQTPVISSITSSPGTLGDATQTSRAEVSWSAITDNAVLNGGAIQIQWTPLDQAIPSGDWPGTTVSGRATKEVVAGLSQRRRYLFRVRAWSGLAWSAWSNQVAHQMAAAPLVGTAQVQPGAVTVGAVANSSTTAGGSATLGSTTHVGFLLGGSYAVEAGHEVDLRVSGTHRLTLFADIALLRVEVWLERGASYIDPTPTEVGRRRTYTALPESSATTTDVPIEFDALDVPPAGTWFYTLRYTVKAVTSAGALISYLKEYESSGQWRVVRRKR